MSHDFEPTDAEKEMLSYMKDIEVNQKQTELGEIIVTGKHALSATLAVR